MIERGLCCKNNGAQNQGLCLKKGPGDSDSVAVVKTNCNNWSYIKNLLESVYENKQQIYGGGSHVVVHLPF